MSTAISPCEEPRPGTRLMVATDDGLQSGIVRGITVAGEVVVTVGQRAYILSQSEIRKTARGAEGES